ncbi:MAG: hypothetical protein JGK17_15695 [Microcoleus sp. PH2017_10_PVI_O_A]|uniref:DUF7017 domain-containing protein n=1 Tax=unclassified Microcoleus TaxID=2642155 RepID=UPI001E0837C9|nr:MULTISPECIES: hypothetical protein [unclassified Microcoleus]TAE84160.1 MAG: hypothetical protein EAZ83_06935 [Oscillatoriales cyanobacterium]MCC3407004.1 hypothetical protein [Microcoleus sp. PH2017_10_PVI_O_A]MCC3459466.1 hypothetical protein [Microcoleus sp. PH2017_11_PCY_U_A]MCC3477904.1 hypothetical protein [Microcoleus sp. PH2017_12_PCY_D_A]MCC3530338.1 hypothetical protein [Microcoleus sp. PH2017_21_RUC_O_A]
MSNLSEEITNLRKAGQIDRAYFRGYELLKEHPNDERLANSIGWVLYEKVKRNVEAAKQSQSIETNMSVSQLREILGEYYKLKLLRRPDLLFSLLLSQTLRFPQELKFLPKFIKWAGIDSFRAEDFQVSTGKDGTVFESLVEKTAREVGKIACELTAQEYPDQRELQNFAVKLIDVALDRAKVQKPEWLNYRKALLLNRLGRSPEAQKLLVSFVKQKRSDYWAWHALAKVVETSDPQLALALCAKACLTCRDENFGVSVFEDLSRLAANRGQEKVAKWAADRAFTIRNNNGWKVPQSLRNLLTASWYNRAGNLSNAEEVLANIAADAEKVIWQNCPRSHANYLETFVAKSGTRMVEFGRLYNGVSEKLVSPERGMLKNLNLRLGDPVTVTVDDSGDRLTVVAVEKRESGKLFDSVSHKTGQFRLCQGRDFGFVDDVYVPSELACQLQNDQKVNVAVVKKFDKKKEKWGLSAIAILN